jgi:hypothetical protein
MLKTSLLKLIAQAKNEECQSRKGQKIAGPCGLADFPTMSAKT